MAERGYTMSVSLQLDGSADAWIHALYGEGGMAYFQVNFSVLVLGELASS